jgi:predicted ATPase
MLNGTMVKLGAVADVVDQVHGRQIIEIGLSDNEVDFHWSFAGERSDLSMKVHNISVGTELADLSAPLRYLLPFPEELHAPLDDAAASLASRFRRLTYITAERVGPRDVYDLQDQQSATVVGATGEDATSVLYWGRDEPVLDELLLPDVPSTRPRQVEGRLRNFFPGCTLELQRVPQANALTLGVRTSPDTGFLRPIHAGFGITQVLPIVVAALSASPNDILLIENPEVHLHPAGQALMGGFLADVASAGIQVLIETHSDHVLNGIRRAVKSARLSPVDVAIHYFKQRSEGEAQVISPQIDPSGNIDVWPRGFFDQFDKDSSYFAGWGEDDGPSLQ